MVNPIDRVAQGEPETVVYLPHGGQLLGLHIRAAGAWPAMLGIRLNPQGEPVSCAIAESLYLAVPSEPPQSNPRRPAHGYGAVEDDGDGA